MVRDSPRDATVVAAVVGKLLLVVVVVLFVSETKPPVPTLQRTDANAAADAAAAPFSISRILNGQFERCAAAPNGSSPLRKRMTIDLHAQHFTMRSSPV